MRARYLSAQPTVYGMWVSPRLAWRGRWKRLAATGLAAGAVLLSGCGGGGSSAEPTAGADPQVFTTATAATAVATIGSNGGVVAVHNPQVRP